MSIYDNASSGDMLTASDIARKLSVDTALSEVLRGPGTSIEDAAFTLHPPVFTRQQKAAPLVTTEQVVQVAQSEGVTSETVGDPERPRATLYSLSGVREALGLEPVAPTAARRAEDHVEPDPDERPKDLDSKKRAAHAAGITEDDVQALIDGGAVTDWSEPLVGTDGQGEQIVVKRAPVVSLAEVKAAARNTLGL